VDCDYNNKYHSGELGEIKTRLKHFHDCVKRSSWHYLKIKMVVNTFKKHSNSDRIIEPMPTLKRNTGWNTNTKSMPGFV
jgi:hypothetical protein